MTNKSFRFVRLAGLLAICLGFFGAMQIYAQQFSWIEQVSGSNSWETRQSSSKIQDQIRSFAKIKGFSVESISATEAIITTSERINSNMTESFRVRISFSSQNVRASISGSVGGILDYGMSNLEMLQRNAIEGANRDIRIILSDLERVL